MQELHILNYAIIHLIFLIWEEVHSLAIQKGKKHKDKEISSKSFLVSFFAKKKSNLVSLTVSDSDQDQCPSSSSSDVQHKEQCTMLTFVLNASVTEAEILRAIRTVLTHSSQRLCDSLSKLFFRMFSDSIITKSFTLERRKYSYFINFGIAPYLKELLLAKLKSSGFFVTCYDESLNPVLQEEQMDVALRYFNNESCMVESSYFDSAFLKRPNSQNLHVKLLESVTALDLEKLIQILMDGPNVNWDILSPYSSYREKK